MEKDTPLVSIILPCYFQGEYLADALNSLLNQTYTNWEAIIINDGSNDSTEEVARTFCNNDTRFHYFYQENKGVSSARNNAVYHSSGSFIVPLDPDDIIMPTFIEKCLNIFDKEPQYSLVYSKIKFFGRKNRMWNIPSYQNYKEFLLTNCIVCTSMFKRSDFLQCGGYDEKMLIGMEDWEFYIRLLKPNSKVYQIQEPLFLYRIKKQSRTTNCAIAENKKIVLEYIYNKHIQLYDQIIGTPLAIFQEYAFYKRKYTKHHNKWYKKLWRHIKKITHILS